MRRLDLDLDALAARMTSWIERLARFSSAEPPAIERVLFTDADLAARRFVAELAEAAALATRSDPAGNTFFRLEGLDPEAAPVGTGSHIDAIPNAGAYDGTVGVLGAIAALAAIRDAAITPPRPLEVVAFTSEEPTRFGLGCVGSRLMSGAVSPDQVRALVDGAGRPFEEVRRGAGLTGALEEVRLRPGHFAAFVELHVEQGPILEAEGVPVGAVTAIAAPASYELTLRGIGGHAGAVLMPDRRDALAAGAEVILAVEGAARRSASPDTVATVGVCQVHPGAVNSIPSRVQLMVDLRDTDLGTRESAWAAIRSDLERIGAERRVAIDTRTINADPPATCDASVVDAIEVSAQTLGLRTLRMVSRAYHDALFLARIAPTGMIFIPSALGVSHRPDEWTAPEDLARGVAVLAETMLRLAEDPPGAAGPEPGDANGVGRG